MRWLIVGACAVTMALTHFTAYRSGKAVVRAEWTETNLAQTNEARKIENRREAMLKESTDAARKRDAIAAKTSLDLRSELAGLRDDLATARGQLSTASTASLRRRIQTYDAVFEQCAQRVEGLAGTTQGIASDTRLILDAWPK